MIIYLIVFKIIYSHCIIGKKHNWEILKPEWVIFIKPDWKMAKLRLDMFDWYEGEGIGCS